jgi:hypothetical protein
MSFASRSLADIRCVFRRFAANMVCSPSGIHKVSAQEGDYENRRHSGDVDYRDRGHDVGIIEKIGAKRVTVRLIGPMRNRHSCADREASPQWPEPLEI